MPLMWFAKHGARPHSQFDPATSISIEEVKAIVGTHEAKFVGTEAPSINPSQPSRTVENVVLEVQSALDVGAPLHHVGFYFVVGLSPHEAERTLRSLRGKV